MIFRYNGRLFIEREKAPLYHKSNSFETRRKEGASCRYQEWTNYDVAPAWKSRFCLDRNLSPAKIRSPNFKVSFSFLCVGVLVSWRNGLRQLLNCLYFCRSTANIVHLASFHLWAHRLVHKWTFQEERALMTCPDFGFTTKLPSELRGRRLSCHVINLNQ